MDNKHRHIIVNFREAKVKVRGKRENRAGAETEFLSKSGLIPVLFVFCFLFFKNK